jgi:prolipoprotein diacylglyceryl transferase
MPRPYDGYREQVHPVAYLPSPSQSVWHLGPIPVRAYALCIVAGIFLALWLTARRMRERGGQSEDVWDVAGWAIVFGIIGGRLYHVVTDPELYFEHGKHPIDALKIWDGGLGIWGAIALGGVGAWIGCRRRKIKLADFADACIPGVVFAQGIGRWGNYFNNELYGSHTSLPWGLQVHCMFDGRAVAVGQADGGQICNGSSVVPGLFQPTFLYESIWDIALGVALILIDRKLRLGRGNVFALYVMGYTAGRGWIEALRTDPAHHFLGLRLNDWTAIVVFLAGLALFLRHGGFRAKRDESPYFDPAAGPPLATSEPDATEHPDANDDTGSEELAADARRDE